MKSDRYDPGASAPDGGSVGTGVGLGIGVGVPVGGSLGAAVGIGEDPPGGLDGTTPVVHATAKSAIATPTTKVETRRSISPSMLSPGRVTVL
jgi:hypothetical protein